MGFVGKCTPQHGRGNTGPDPLGLGRPDLHVRGIPKGIRKINREEPQEFSPSAVFSAINFAVIMRDSPHTHTHTR